MSKPSVDNESNLPSTLSILFAEDDPSLSVIYERVLKQLNFGRIWSAPDGEEGLRLFEQVRPDIVLSDIMMPRMDGLEMAQRIKQISPETPVIMATASSEKSFLMRSIEIGIDRYVVKPIERKQFDATLLQQCQVVHERRAAEEYARQKIQRRINSATANTLSEVANLFPNPTIIYSPNQHIHFINDAFTNMLDTADLARLSTGEVTLDALLIKRDGFLHSLQELLEEQNHRVVVRRNHINNIFQVACRVIRLGEAQESYTVFTFTNITRLEYEKIKSENMSRLLRESIRVRNSAPASSKSHGQTPTVSSSLLSNAELAVLRRSHQHKTSAADYLTTLDNEIIGQIEELAEVDLELEEGLVRLGRTPHRTALEVIATDMLAYARALRQLVDFNDLAFALEQLAELIVVIDPATINVNKFILLMDSVRMDLADWRRMIFISQEARDIHYLDSSLFSSCMQLQLEFAPGEEQGEDETGDLELF